MAGKKRAAKKSPRRTQKKRSFKTASHVLVPGSKRPRVKFAARIRDLDPREHVEVTLTLKGPSLPGPNDLPDTSLTPSEFEKQYGASRSDLDTVAKVLKKYGLTVNQGSLTLASIETHAARSFATAKEATTSPGSLPA